MATANGVVQGAAEDAYAEVLVLEAQRADCRRQGRADDKAGRAYGDVRLARRQRPIPSRQERLRASRRRAERAHPRGQGDRRCGRRHRNADRDESSREGDDQAAERGHVHPPRVTPPRHARRALDRPEHREPRLPDSGAGQLDGDGAGSDAVAAGAAEADLAMIAPLAAAAVALATPGVTPTQITLGGTVPLTGIASAYGSVARGSDAYFKYVNSKGGGFGRKIVFKYEDDAYEVPKTILLTRQLVEQDNVLAIFDSVGTEHALAVRPYLNDRRVPQLFVGSGVSKLAGEHRKYPWSMGYLPSSVGEGAIYGRYIATHQPKARIAVLYENSDFGKDMLNGLRRGLAGKAKIVGTQSYEIVDLNVDSQLAKLKSTGADTLMLFATPGFAIFGYVG